VEQYIFKVISAYAPR